MKRFNIAYCFLILVSCADYPDISGSWSANSPVSITATIKQNHSALSATGWIARVGRDSGYKVPVAGSGVIRADSSVRLDLQVQIGGKDRLVVLGRLLNANGMSVTLRGGRFPSPTPVLLSREPNFNAKPQGALVRPPSNPKATTDGPIFSIRADRGH